VEALESFASAGEVVTFTAKGNFRALGTRFGKQTPDVAKAIAAADAAALAQSLSADGSAAVEVDGSSVTLTADEVIISERPREGWAVVNDQGETIALDLEIDTSLRQAGLAREIVRLVQEARKSRGLDVTDRIRLRWFASGETLDVLTSRASDIAAEVLAVSVTIDESATSFSDPELGLTFDLDKAFGQDKAFGHNKAFGQDEA